MMNSREVIATSDAVRPGSDDLHAPELASLAQHLEADPQACELFERVQRFDRAVGRAMHDVPLPPDFEQRLIARLKPPADSPISSAVDHALVAGPTVGEEAVAELERPAALHHTPASVSMSRRLLIKALGGGVAVAVAVALAVIFWPSDRVLYEEDLQNASVWHNDLRDRASWPKLTSDEIDEHPLPNELRWIPERWRDASSELDREATAYDLTRPGGPRATLFVIPQPQAAGIGATAPPTPQFSTQGYSVAYWQFGGNVYVVVVESDRQRDYQHLLRLTVPSVT